MAQALKILTGNAHPALAGRIAEYIGQPLGGVDISRFPDGEIFVKIIENIRGQDIFIVQPTCFPPNENIMELLIMIDAAKRASAARITPVIPFYGYGRQDRKDQPRVPITAKLVANLLVAAGADRILTMDMHAQQIQGFFDIPVDHLFAAPVIVRHLKSLGWTGDKMVVVTPDPGGLKMAYAYSNMLSAGLAIVGKQRKSATEVEAINVVGDVEGRNVLLVDDLTTTAGTLTSAAALLKARGAKKIIAAVTHCLLTDQGFDRLRQSAIEEMITTDSVPQRTDTGIALTVLSVAELLGEAILRVHNDQSVTSLFRIS
ncbi:MAG TPA: ribose-phosphate pyrophosphokinase [Kiritimatiellia bacterium]|nr:ribose-phosphate pyrophosphokinase [Kiritimatiellia bacterium]HMO98853.1 ribose-phosphate pyrophosphokinase [Kiritimatiellia bacterium]HMP97274.1 ribose-phosphate pyrophosphokinase [Kiritimatiellia bacterium]